MQPDPSRVTDTKAWLKKAQIDLRGATAENDLEPPIREHVVFHCQQASEKSIKAYLTWHDQPFRKTHDIGELGQQCVKLDASLEPLLKQASKLSVYAWAFRYPGDPSEPCGDETLEALSLSHKVFENIKSRLPSYVHP